MAFIGKTQPSISGLAKLLADSSKILSSFSKTREELVKLNNSLGETIQSHKTKIDALEQERLQMNSLVIKHSKVIDNIDKF